MDVNTFIYGGSYNPVGCHHRRVMHMVLEYMTPYDRLVIYPCGLRPDKDTTNHVAPEHRARMLELELDLVQDPRVHLDVTDLDREEFTRTWDLDERFKQTGRQIWHVIGTDLIDNGAQGASEMQRSWHRGTELFEHGRFLVIQRPGVDANHADLPPNSVLLTGGMFGSSTRIRNRVRAGQRITGLVSAPVESYIHKHGLYRS